MKSSKIYLLLFILSFFISTCKKDTTPPQSYTNEEMLYEVPLPEDASPEMKRIYSTLQKSDFEMGIIDNPNGESTTPGEYDIMMSGRTEPADQVSVQLNDTVISAQANGQWMFQNNTLRQFYGRSVNVSIRSNNKPIERSTIYIPKTQIARIHRNQDSIGINRNSSITWTPDTEDPCGKIFLRVETSDERGNSVAREVKILKNNGNYSLAEVLRDPRIKRIYFALISGNWVLARVNGKTLVFGIETVNHHEYTVR